MYTAVILFLPILTIQFDDVAALKYPLVVNMINVVEPIRRSQNQSGYVMLNEQRNEELKQKRHKMQQKRLNIFYQKHQARINVVIEHMEKYLMSSVYLYQEVQRIIRTGKIRDTVREMLVYMDEAGDTKRKQLRSYFYVCYQAVKPTEKKEVWNVLNNNNLVIHPVKDPMNDGVN